MEVQMLRTLVDDSNASLVGKVRAPRLATLAAL